MQFPPSRVADRQGNPVRCTRNRRNFPGELQHGGEKFEFLRERQVGDAAGGNADTPVNRSQDGLPAESVRMGQLFRVRPESDAFFTPVDHPVRGDPVHFAGFERQRPDRFVPIQQPRKREEHRHDGIRLKRGSHHAGLRELRNFGLKFEIEALFHSGGKIPDGLQNPFVGASPAGFRIPERLASESRLFQNPAVKRCALPLSVVEAVNIEPAADAVSHQLF